MDAPIADDEVVEEVLMRVKQERCDAKRKNRNSEVDQARRPERQRHVEQHEQGANAQVVAGAGETRKRMLRQILVVAKPRPVAMYPGASEGEIAEDGMGIDRGREDVEHG